MDFTSIKEKCDIQMSVVKHYTNGISPNLELLKLIVKLWCKDKHPLADFTFEEARKLLTSNKKNITISKDGNKRVIMYKSECEWDMCTANARGVTIDNDTKTFSYCLPKFFSDEQLNIKLLDDELYTVYSKYDGSAIYIKNGKVSTLRSFNSKQASNLIKFIGNDIISKFPMNYVIFGEFVDPENDSKVERSSRTFFAITFAYNEIGEKIFPDQLKKILHSDIVNSKNIDFAEPYKITGKEIYNKINKLDEDVIKSNNINLMREGFVVWDKFGIPFKIKSPLYLKMSKVTRARNFKMDNNDFDEQLTKYLASVSSTVGKNNIYHNCIIKMMKQEFNDYVDKLKSQAVDKMNTFISKWNKVVKRLVDVEINDNTIFSDISKYFYMKIDNVPIGQIIGPYGKNLKNKPISDISWNMFL